MSYSLIVVDMQDYFLASRLKRVQNNCIREIKKAMDDNATIVFVEFDGYGPTIPQLTSLVKNKKYKKSHTVLKNMDDGGQPIHKLLVKRHLPRRNLKVCGVNTQYCVLSTIEGLMSRLKESSIEVVGDEIGRASCRER